MSKRIKEIHGERPSSLTDEDYQAILDAEEGIFYLTKPEMSEVEKRQAAMRLTKGKLEGVTYFQIGVTTGRMANTNPDLQTIPGTEFKRKRFVPLDEIKDAGQFDESKVHRLT